MSIQWARCTKKLRLNGFLSLYRYRHLCSNDSSFSSSISASVDRIPFCAEKNLAVKKCTQWVKVAATGTKVPQANTRRFNCIQKHPPDTVSLVGSKCFSAKSQTTHVGICMPNFKVVNKTLKFKTQGEISFVDLSDKVLEVVAASGIKNGIVHVYAPHATGVLTSKPVLKNWCPNTETTITPPTLTHICVRCSCRQTKPCQLLMVVWSLGLGSRCFLWKPTFIPVSVW